MSLDQLLEQANNIGEPSKHTPREWLEHALRYNDLARIAERNSKREEMLVNCTRAIKSYYNCKAHPGFKDTAAKDAHWASRVNDYKDTYAALMKKAKDLKDQLRAREESARRSSTASPSGGPSPAAVDSHAGGSIADRMKALGGHGMDIGSASKRISRDLGPPPGRIGGGGGGAVGGAVPGVSVTGGAGNFGPARYANQVPSPSTSANASAPSRLPINGNASMGNGVISSNTESSVNESPRESQSPRPPQPLEHPRTPVEESARAMPTSQYDDDLPAPPARPTALPSSPTDLPGRNDFAPPASTSSPAQPPSLPSSSTQPPPVPNAQTRPPRPLPKPDLHGVTTARAGSTNVNASPTTPSLPQSPRSHDLSSALRNRSPLPPTPRDLPPSPSHRPAQAAVPSPTHELPPPSAASYDRPPLPMAPPPTSSGPASAYSPDADLRSFESAFPSLSEFGKQFDSLDIGPGGNGSGGRHVDRLPVVDEPEEFKLPSVPTTRPGLPPPPSRPDDLLSPDSKLPSPPVPDFGDLKRPASTPMLTETDMLSSPPVPQSGPQHSLQPILDVPTPPADHRALSPSVPAPGSRQRSHSPMAFPVPKPSVPPGNAPPPGGAPALGSKPEFPISNSVLPETLRGYFLNLTVDMLFLDVRPEEEFKRGYVGQEYESRGAKVNVVWMDPTVVMREGLTSAKLEDSLSLSPEKQRLAFQNRHKFDLVVMYDSKSTSFPRRGTSPSPVSRLLEVIQEKEFAKPLPRFPVLLVGGYEGWVDFIKKRQQRHSVQAMHAAQAAHKSNGIPRTESKMDVKRRDMPVYQSASFAKDITDKLNYGLPQSMTGENSAYITRPGPSTPRHGSSSSVSYSTTSPTIVPPPPAAPIHPGPGARRRSDYMESHNQSYSGYTPASAVPRGVGAIDYPQTYALAHNVPKPPPAAAQHGSERQDLRPAVVRSGSTRFDVEGGAKYWVDAKLGLTGLKNLGNTCYMNSTIQCLSATLPFARYFLDGRYKRDINLVNNLGTKGNLANAFAELLKALWEESYTFLSPITFRKNIIAFKSDFAGSEQHDSQEFLSFVMDGLHEDLNRIKSKPPAVEMTPERENLLETLPPQQASDMEWKIYKMRNDSFIVDLFQGQYMNRLECLTCGKTSTVYDSFQWLTLDLPSSRNKVVLPELFDRWVSPEILDGDEKWFCPRCKVNRRASKTLTLVRLPPVLLIQLKRFIPVNNGRFWNKSDTPVIFPLKNLDLTRYVPARKATGSEDLNDPRTQVGPFKYDLYGVSNHMGTLSSGHYTAYVRSGNDWMFCEDSKVQKATEHDVVSRPAYILFYKRVPA